MHLRVSPVLRLKPGGRQFCIIKQPCFKQGQPSGVAARPPWADLVVHHGKLSNSLSMREQIGCFILFRNMTRSFEVKWWELVMQKHVVGAEDECILKEYDMRFAYDTCIWLYIYIHIYIYIYIICVYMHMYIHVDIYVYSIYLYTYIWHRSDSQWLWGSSSGLGWFAGMSLHAVHILSLRHCRIYPTLW